MGRPVENSEKRKKEWDRRKREKQNSGSDVRALHSQGRVSKKIKGSRN